MTVECSCTPDTEYADGSKPEFYYDAQMARAAFVKAKFNNPTYWGVHFNGQHLVGTIQLYLAPLKSTP